MKRKEDAVRKMIGIEAPLDFYRERNREWLETNGIGGFASSSAVECHTRKYHGLLVTPVEGAEGRFVLLSSVEASFSLEGEECRLASNQYPGTVYPRGWTRIQSFSIFPFPTWEYRFGTVLVRKQVYMRNGDPSVYLAFILAEGPDILAAELKPLFAFRNSHHLAKANDGILRDWSVTSEGIGVQPYRGLPALNLGFSGDWEARGGFDWEYNVEYFREQERGQDFSEDRFFPGTVEISLVRGVPYIVRASLSPPDRDPERLLPEIHEQETAARSASCAKVKTPEALLRHNAVHFLVTNSQGRKSVVAGYPWFGEWGRDTMIALPGLTMFNGLQSLGKDVLLDYASLIRDGLLPNTLGEMQGFTSYNSVDAGLLYFRAAGLLLESGFGDNEAEAEILSGRLFPALAGIMRAFLEDRVPHCRLTAGGFLSAGSEDTQLTWMDAKAWGKPVTPRHGLAVDLNALWYMGLMLVRSLSDRFGVPFPERAQEILSGFPGRFTEVFWMKDRGFLADTVRDGKPDGKLRPNMLFATAAGDLLPREVAAEAVETARRDLLTPWGLRTLGPDDPEYAPWYEGDGNTRDSRYHQGTVWPWLLGNMVESALRVTGDLHKELRFWENYLKELLTGHLGNQGIGFISEVFDGAAGRAEGQDAPPGKGCFAQAWSVGEVIRAFYLVEKGKQSLKDAAK